MSASYSAAFSGSNSLSVANYTGNPAAFSVSCWVYLNVSQTSRVFFSNYQATGSKGWAPGIDDSTSNKVKFYLGGSTVLSATILASARWYHCVFTYDGTVGRIYLNGNPTPDASLTAAVSYGSAPANNYIGSLDGSSQRVNGMLAAVGYWSKTLTTTEVASLYNGGLGLSYADLSGSLLTSLGSYHDFAVASNLGLDSSASARNYANSGGVAPAIGPSPAARSYRVKPPAPAWRAERAPAGCKFYVLLAENPSQPYVDLAQGRAGGVVGTPAWQSGPYGPQVGGFTTLNHLAKDFGTQVFGPSYPLWWATLAIGTGTSQGGLFSQGDGGVHRSGGAYNVASPGSLSYFIEGVTLTATGLPTSDGLPHVAMGYSLGATDHHLCFDGIEVATSSSTAATMIGTKTWMGVDYNAGPGGPLSGSLVAVLAGDGQVPDPASLAYDLLAGNFSAARPRMSAALLAPASTPATVYHAGAAMSAATTTYYAF